MTTNALTNKGHANRRPAVCKESEPSECPYGFVEAEVLAVNDDPLLEVTFVFTLHVPEDDSDQTYEAEWTSNVGTVVAEPIINLDEAVFPVVSGLTDLQSVVLYLVAKAPNGCTYRGVAQAVAAQLQD